MNFYHDSANPEKLKDTVFRLAEMAKEAQKQYGAESVVNATIGSLCDEEGKLVVLKSVYSVYDAVPASIKAGYAPAILGNPEYREAVREWILEGRLSDLNCRTAATAGGTGAVSGALDICLEKGQTVLIPRTCWASYRIMANYLGLHAQDYPLFREGRFDLKDLEKIAKRIMEQQGKLVLILNDPCQNPTGFSLSAEEWESTVSLLNRLSEKGPVVLVNDIAYIDYAKDPEKARDYFSSFENISDRVCVIVAFSCSKTMTAYGMRTGAALILAKKSEDSQNILNLYERYGRTTWSNINHGFMTAFTQVVREHRREFLQEKAACVKMLAERSSLFVNEAQSCGLPIYPYRDGFFCTVAMEDDEKLAAYHDALIQSRIFTVKVNKGIRVALCSVPLARVKGLAGKMKEILDTVG